MKRLSFVCLLILSVNCRKFTHDCAKIGDTYEVVKANCGIPTRNSYRSGYLSQVDYHEFGSMDRLIIMFDINETVNVIDFASPKFNYREYAED